GFIGPMAKKNELGALGSPELARTQLEPPLVLLKTPPPYIPTYNMAGFAGSIAKLETRSCKLLVSPEFVGTQLAPPLVLLYTPPKYVPAYSVAALVGSTTIELTYPSGQLVATQLAPPLIDLKTPPWAAA